MARQTVPSAIEGKAPEPPPFAGISLTLTRAESGHVLVKVSIAECIAYSQNTGFTRLNLTGGKVLDVKETTDQIDKLARAAASRYNVAAGEIAIPQLM